MRLKLQDFCKTLEVLRLWEFFLAEPSGNGSIGDTDLFLDLFERDRAFRHSDADEFGI